MPEIPNAKYIEQCAASVTINFTSPEAAARFFATHSVALAPRPSCRERVENDEEKPKCPRS